jgi:hypothetical protein
MGNEWGNDDEELRPGSWRPLFVILALVAIVAAVLI